MNVYFECDPKYCACINECTNMQIQKNDVVTIEKFLPKDKGWGVQTTFPLEKGTFVAK